MSSDLVTELTLLSPLEQSTCLCFSPIRVRLFCLFCPFFSSFLLFPPSHHNISTLQASPERDSALSQASDLFGGLYTIDTRVTVLRYKTWLPISTAASRKVILEDRLRMFPHASPNTSSAHE